MMRRLTEQDWETINEGLALLEASIVDEETRRRGESLPQAESRLSGVRSKVHERVLEREGPLRSSVRSCATTASRVR